MEGMAGKVKVSFPQDALDVAANISIHKPLPKSMPPTSLTGQPFEITARRQSSVPRNGDTVDQASSGHEIKTFGKVVQIELSYAGQEVSD